MAEQSGEEAAFVAALNDAIHAAQITHKRLADATDWTTDYIRKITRGERIPKPQGVFALEEALKLRPGELSRHLGFVPVDAAGSVVEAIEADPDLSSEARRHLLALYREARRG